MCSAYDARIFRTLARLMPVKQLICRREAPDFRIRMIALPCLLSGSFKKSSVLAAPAALFILRSACSSVMPLEAVFPKS